MKSKRKGQLSFHFCGDDKTVEVVLRTIISVNQLSICGAVADMCDELARRVSDCSERTGELVALTELMTTNKSPRTDENMQGNLLHNYEQKFANLSIDQTMLQCRYHEDRGQGTVLHEPRRCRTGHIGRLMSRAYSSSRRQIIQNKKDGSVGTRRSVQLWRWQSVIKDVTESRS